MPEYRAWITIPGLPIEPDDASLALHRTLDRDHGELGPILGGDARGVQVVLSTTASDPAAAAGELHAAVVDSLRIAGLEHLYPSAIELEVVDEHTSAVA
ncbi:MAG TPA: hypothetical protein VF257_18340 [Solirubrobacteraceae bacterium]